MSKIVTHFTKIIFPFQYEQCKIKDKIAILEEKSESGQPIFEQFSQSCNGLREGLDLLLDERGGASKIADCYKLNVNCRKLFNLPPRKSDSLDFFSRQLGSTAKSVAIQEIKIYLFESNVGFVELECEYKTDSIDDYIDLNYFICEAKSDKNYFVYHEKQWNPHTKTASVLDKQLTVANLLESVFERISLENNGIVPLYKQTKPILYSFILLDKKPDDLDGLLIHFAKNYKESYQLDTTCSLPQMLHPFENSYWACSSNAVVNVSFLTGNSQTDDFFSNSFIVNTRNTYFFLFLNVLHQRYAIMSVMGQMGHLDRLSNDYIIMEEQLRVARILEAKAISLKFRAFFKWPSGIDHINQYYDLVYNAFQVGSLYDTFSADIKNLQGICSKYVERIKERDERFKKRKNAKIEIFVSIFGVVVAEVTLLNNSWSLIERILGHTISILSPAIFILFAALLTPLITITLNVSKQIFEIKRLSRLIEIESEDDLVEDDEIRAKKIKSAEKLRKRRNKDKFARK